MQKFTIAVINGPNLNLLGKREPEIYGNEGFDAYLEQLKSRFSEVDFHYFQSNIEGELVTAIQDFGFSADGIILNAAAYTHTSVAIGDAVKAIPARVVEVHISNTFSREVLSPCFVCIAPCFRGYFRLWLRRLRMGGKCLVGEVEKVVEKNFF